MQFFSYMYKLQQVFEGRKYSREENYSSLGGFDGGWKLYEEIRQHKITYRK